MGSAVGIRQLWRAQLLPADTGVNRHQSLTIEKKKMNAFNPTLNDSDLLWKHCHHRRNPDRKMKKQKMKMKRRRMRRMLNWLDTSTVPERPSSICWKRNSSSAIIPSSSNCSCT